MGPDARLDSAQQDMDHEQLASAVAKFQAITNDASMPDAVRSKANIQMQLAQQKQQAMVPRMKDLLDQAQKLYDAGKLDDAQNALNTVAAIGAPMNWEDAPRAAKIQGDIANKKMAMARGGAATQTTVMGNPATPAGNPMDAVAQGPATKSPAQCPHPTQWM